MIPVIDLSFSRTLTLEIVVVCITDITLLYVFKKKREIRIKEKRTPPGVGWLDGFGTSEEGHTFWTFLFHSFSC